MPFGNRGNFIHGGKVTDDEERTYYMQGNKMGWDSASKNQRLFDAREASSLAAGVTNDLPSDPEYSDATGNFKPQSERDWLGAPLPNDPPSKPSKFDYLPD